MESLSLRERIAMTIATRDPLEDWCGNPISWADISEGHRECYRRDADAILAIPGIAVVELPEPDRGGGYGDDGVGWGTDNNSVFTSGGMVYDQCGEFSPAQAREIGLRWLAAADYAERDQ